MGNENNVSIDTDEDLEKKRKVVLTQSAKDLSSSHTEAVDLLNSTEGPQRRLLRKNTAAQNDRSIRCSERYICLQIWYRLCLEKSEHESRCRLISFKL